MQTLIHVLYMLASVLFIFGLKRMSKIKTSAQGNGMAALAMLIAIAATLMDLVSQGKIEWPFIIAGIVVGSAIGAWYALTVQMTQMPQMVGLFNGFGGLSSFLVGFSFFWENMIAHHGGETTAVALGADQAVTIALSIFVGGITFSGSLVAYAKLEGSILGKKVPDQPVLLPGRHVLNVALFLGAILVGWALAFLVQGSFVHFLTILVLSVIALAMGITLVIAIGGADMPVVISLLNSYSGIAASMTGFVIQNNLLIISGALVGSAGLILTNIMCKAMNRSLANVIFGGFGAVAATGGGKEGYTNVKSTGPEELAMILDAATKVIFVPGYGLAVAQAQHACRELGDMLEKKGVEVSYAIHPVAGRMPGHMNVLLAEANVPYDKLFEMDQINAEFKTTDVAIILGANDVVNPAALHDKNSPIYGMPILNVHEARTVVVVKRSLGAGFAGIRNELFDADNSLMFFSDAKKALTDVIEELKAV
ncbi:MAG: NAD(P)(+) transhydrogenase (Re/Si-specific) subunit beta [Deltaproteobacteria bacterium]|nr:NAD(P)(+) transhydrogenase (Re/Si-specific) subunit beta [Deltaproteobacteria bacterium]